MSRSYTAKKIRSLKMSQGGAETWIEGMKFNQLNKAIRWYQRQSRICRSSFSRDVVLTCLSAHCSPGSCIRGKEWVSARNAFNMNHEASFRGIRMRKNWLSFRKAALMSIDMLMSFPWWVMPVEDVQNVMVRRGWSSIWLTWSVAMDK